MKTAEGTASGAGPQRAAAHGECRVWQRHDCDLSAACQPVAARLDKDVRWPGQIRDLSATGMGLVLGRRFERGAVLVTELPGDGAAGPATLLARVVHVTALAGGRWLLGCAFCSRLSEDRLRGLLGSDRPAPAGVCGSAPAHPSVVHQPAAENSNGAGQSLVLRGVILEGPVPGGGRTALRLRELRFWGRWPLAAGTLLRLRLTTRRGVLCDVQVRVRACEPRGERWVLRYELAPARR